jgi:hypothetical protein
MAERDSKGKFQKGNKASKGHGRPSLRLEDEKGVKLTRLEFQAAVDKYLRISRDELLAIAKDKKLRTLDTMIVASLVKAIQGGDTNRLNWFLEQLFGKAKSEIDITTNNQSIAGNDVPVVFLPLNGKTIEENTIETTAKEVKKKTKKKTTKKKVAKKDE